MIVSDNIQVNYYQVNSSLIMCILKTLTDLYSVKQNTRVKNTFVRVVSVFW